MNYKALPREDKDALKPLVAEIRKQLYGSNTLLEAVDEDSSNELVINFGKGNDARITVTLKVII